MPSLRNRKPKTTTTASTVGAEQQAEGDTELTFAQQAAAAQAGAKQLRADATQARADAETLMATAQAEAQRLVAEAQRQARQLQYNHASALDRQAQALAEQAGNFANAANLTAAIEESDRRIADLHNEAAKLDEQIADLDARLADLGAERENTNSALAGARESADVDQVGALRGRIAALDEVTGVISGQRQALLGRRQAVGVAEDQAGELAQAASVLGRQQADLRRTLNVIDPERPQAVTDRLLGELQLSLAANAVRIREQQAEPRHVTQVQQTIR